MNIEDKLLALMEGVEIKAETLVENVEPLTEAKKEDKKSDGETATDAGAETKKSDDEAEAAQNADGQTQEPAVSIENPLDPNLTPEVSNGDDQTDPEEGIDGTGADGDSSGDGDQDADDQKNKKVEESIDEMVIDPIMESAPIVFEALVGYAADRIQSIRKNVTGGKVPSSIYAKDAGSLEVGKNYSYLENGTSPRAFKVIGKKSDGTANVRHIKDSSESSGVMSGDEHNFDVNDDFVKKSKIVALHEQAEHIAESELGDIGVELSEEFQLKASTLFQAKVSERVSTLVEEKTKSLNEEFETRLNEAVETREKELLEHIDAYLGAVADKWMVENELAIEASLKSELTESFIDGLKNVFASHYIDLPVEKFDIVASLEEQLKQSREESEKAKTALVEHTEKLTKASRELVLIESTKGMTEIDASKFRTLMEEFEFEDEGTFTKRAEIIKESFFQDIGGDKSNGLKLSTQALVENTETVLTESVEQKDDVSIYADYIRRTGKSQ